MSLRNRFNHAVVNRGRIVATTQLTLAFFVTFLWSDAFLWSDTFLLGDVITWFQDLTRGEPVTRDVV